MLIQSIIAIIWPLPPIWPPVPWDVIRATLIALGV